MFSVKYLFIVGCITALIAVTLSEELPGGVTDLYGKDLKAAEKVLRDSLAVLGAGKGPDYSVLKVVSATSQVVSGTLYKYNAELIDNDKNYDIKMCKVSIWSQPWLPENSTEVTFECAGDEKVIKKHNPKE